MSLLDIFTRTSSSNDVSQELIAETAAVSSGSEVGIGRRERPAYAGTAVISETLGVKLLHGWLQNRHQTLMPLTLNLSNMTQDQQEGLARIMASILLAGRPADAAGEIAPAMRTWLSSLGANTSNLAAFDLAIAGTPLALNMIFETALARELTIYTYVCALVASDARYPVSVMLCDVIQVRFDLPTALVRSAARRYRR